MIMSPSSKPNPLTTFLSESPAGRRSANGAIPICLPSKPALVASERVSMLQSPPSAAKDAIKQLGCLASVSSNTLPVQRALQPVDVNLSKSSRHRALPTKRPSSPRKVRSTSNAGVGARSKSPELATPTPSSAPLIFKGDRISVKIPQKLPAPRLTPHSSPYEDLVAHLARHNLFIESQQVEQYSIAPDFLLQQYLELAHLGKCSLYHQTRNFLFANRDTITAHVVPGQTLPSSVPLDVTPLVTELQVPPTHLLAVHSDGEAATLYAVHGVVLALQCVSIPFLPASKDSQDGARVIKHMPVLALRMPAPQHFETTLRWLYSQSATSLLQELLPLKHILAVLAKRRPCGSAVEGKDVEASAAALSTADLVQAMSSLPMRTFLEHLQTIQAVWKNGVALGIVAWNFWAQLDNAWNLLVVAMVASKRKNARKSLAAASELTAQLESTRLD
ncbi:hypothetical protein L1887_50322 [Cichorium endivia]|nr:hypothetical protein L1887_50322 [Cichorium endivia]